MGSCSINQYPTGNEIAEKSGREVRKIQYEPFKNLKKI